VSEEILFPGHQATCRNPFFDQLVVRDAVVVPLAVYIAPAFTGRNCGANIALNLLDGGDDVTDLHRVVGCALQGIGELTNVAFLRIDGLEVEDRRHAFGNVLTTTTPGDNPIGCRDVVFIIDVVDGLDQVRVVEDVDVDFVKELFHRSNVSNLVEGRAFDIKRSLMKIIA